VALFVDTSVWSLALRRDGDSTAPEVQALRRALEGGEIVVTTGLVLLTTDRDSVLAAGHCTLQVWKP
jgi:hypothetical protein